MKVYFNLVNFNQDFMSFSVNCFFKGAAIAVGIYAYKKVRFENDRSARKNSLYSKEQCDRKVMQLADERWAQKLKLNLEYAHEAMNYTQEVLPLGAVNRSQNSDSQSSDAIVQIELMRVELEHKVKEKRHLHHNFDWFHELVAEGAEKYQAGNCGEQSAVAYVYLKNHKNVRKVERLSLVNGDHGFVVIGRSPLGDVADPETWGKEAVVCDPWANEYFPAEEIFDRFKKLGVYDSSVHSIGWMFTGQIPPEDIIHRGLRFHERSDKVPFANRILNEIKDFGSADHNLIKMSLEDYLKRKSTPKIPPVISIEEQKKVEKIWIKFLENS